MAASSSSTATGTGEDGAGSVRQTAPFLGLGQPGGRGIPNLSCGVTVKKLQVHKCTQYYA